MSVEAVQFRDWAPWHAVVQGKDTTVCGRDPVFAKHMWEPWADKPNRCKQCVKGLRTKDSDQHGN